MFVGGNVRLGYVRLGVRDWEHGASFFSSFFFYIKKMRLKTTKNYGQRPYFLD